MHYIGRTLAICHNLHFWPFHCFLFSFPCFLAVFRLAIFSPYCWWRAINALVRKSELFKLREQKGRGK